MTKEAPQRIDFNDIEALKTKISDRWDDWGSERLVTQVEIETFASLTQNTQWIHTDSERARRESPYKGIIAHGFFIFSLVPSLLPERDYIVCGSKQLIVRGGDAFRFVSPVRPNDTVRARTRLNKVEKKPKGTVLTYLVEVWTLTGTRPAVTSELKLQYF